MKPYELYKNLNPSLVEKIFLFFREEEREIYKSTLASLASHRKLRPVFIQKKPAKDQIAWMHKTLQLKSCDMIGEHLLQVYFMKGQQPLLITFCDNMGIEHNGEGSVEGALPETLDADKLATAVDALIADHDPELVSLYLRVFNLQTKDGWDSLQSVLETDERLKIAQ